MPQYLSLPKMLFWQSGVGHRGFGWSVGMSMNQSLTHCKSTKGNKTVPQLNENVRLGSLRAGRPTLHSRREEQLTLNPCDDSDDASH